jgi:hypothetical protein
LFCRIPAFYRHNPWSVGVMGTASQAFDEG